MGLEVAGWGLEWRVFTDGKENQGLVSYRCRSERSDDKNEKSSLKIFAEELESLDDRSERSVSVATHRSPSPPPLNGLVVKLVDLLGL